MTGFIFTQKYRLEIKTRRNTQLFQNSQSVWIDKSNEQYIYFFQIYKKKKKRILDNQEYLFLKSREWIICLNYRPDTETN